MTREGIVVNPSSRRLVFGSRKSKLAMWQTRAVAEALSNKLEIEAEIQQYSTRGDETLDQPLPEIGGKGLFTAELDRAILNSDVDLAIHSLKDLPTDGTDGLKTVPVLKRADAREVLISRDHLDFYSLPSGARIGTSSPRRQAQLMALRSDIECCPIRGNVPTRIRRVREQEYDATILAAAGVIRLGLESEIAQYFSFEEMLPAAAQGMIAATCRTEDDFVIGLLESIQDRFDTECIEAERRVLSRLGGGCSVPISAYGSGCTRAGVMISVRVSLPDGRCDVQTSFVGESGAVVADQAVEDLLEKGARALLPQKKSSALTNKRICITRAREDCDAIIALLNFHGAQPLVVPAIKIETLPVALPDLRAGDWLAFTSRRGVHAFGELAGIPDADFDALKVACVGPETAAAARDLGLNVEFVPTQSTGKCFAEEFCRHLDSNSGPSRVIYLSAKKTVSNFTERVRRLGIEIVQRKVYETQYVPLAEKTIKSLRSGVDAVIFASPSAVHSFVDQLEQANAIDHLSGDMIMCCIGPTTAHALEEKRLGVKVAVSKSPTMPALIQAIEEQFAGR